MKKKLLMSIPFLYVLINNGKYKNIDIGILVRVKD